MAAIAVVPGAGGLVASAPDNFGKSAKGACARASAFAFGKALPLALMFMKFRIIENKAQNDNFANAS